VLVNGHAVAAELRLLRSLGQPLFMLKG